MVLIHFGIHFALLLGPLESIRVHWGILGSIGGILGSIGVHCGLLGLHWGTLGSIGVHWDPLVSIGVHLGPLGSIRVHLSVDVFDQIMLICGSILSIKKIFRTQQNHSF